MKRTIYLAFLLLLVTQAQAQTVLFTETFNSGSSNWSLNTSDVGSVPGTSGNYWVVNNAYTSLFGNTPTQPAAITGAPTSNYLHIRSILTANATFLAPADGNKFAKMNTGISTIGYTNVTINFWYLCNGDAIATDSYFGRTYYSIDGGNTWIQNPVTYSQVSSWTQTSITNPAFNNQADLRFAFMWVQNSANEFLPADPAFSIDQITVTGTASGGSAPVADFTISNTNICVGQCVQLTSTSTGTITSYQWTTTGGSPSSATTPNVNVCYNTPGTYTVSLTVSNANGSDTKTVNNAITVVAAPNITITPASPAICAGQSSTLQASGASTYTWQPATSLSSSTGASVVATPINNTTYTVTGTNSSGCTANTTVAVTVNSVPNINVTPANSSVCNNQSVQLQASGANTYTWSPSAGLSSTTGNTVTTNPSSTTTYTVTGSNAAGCTSNATAIITVNASPNVSVNNGSVCVGQSTTLTASGASSYSWAPNTGINSTTGAQVSVNPSTTTTYTVTGTGAGGCTASATAIVTVNNPPLIAVNSASICAGGSVTLTASGASTYTWAPAATLSASTGATVTATPAQTITYTVTGTSAAGCISTATAVVTVGSSLNIIVNSPVICQGATTTLIASGALNYTWSPNTALNQSTGASVEATPSETITYTVTGFDANGCSGSAEAVVGVKPPPTLTAFNDSICKGQVALLSVIGASSFVWSPAAGLNTTSGNNVQANVSNTTTYVVTGTDANGCTASVQVIAFVYPETNGTINGLNATYFTNSSSSTLTGTPPGGTFSGPGIAGNVFDPAFAGVGTHTITYSFIDANGCQGSASATTTVTFPVSVKPISDDTSIQLYPNPSNGVTYLQIHADRQRFYQLNISDVSGRIIQYRSVTVNAGLNQIEMELSTSGVYFVQIQNETQTRVLKMIVE